MLDFFRELQKLVPEAAQHFPDEIQHEWKEPQILRVPRHVG
jgi:hypothetical protein